MQNSGAGLRAGQPCRNSGVRRKKESMNDRQLRQILTTRRVGTERRQRNAAILLPVVEVEGQDALLFEVRSQSLDMQPGEVCFPGGRIEPGETPEEAALREIWEELRIQRGQIEILGPLDHMVHFTGTVFPMLGRVDPLALRHLRLSEEEVAEVFTVPLDFFLACPVKQYTYYMSPDNLEELPASLADYIRRYRQKYVTPAWCYGGHTIWGMTARAVNRFLHFLQTE